MGKLREIEERLRGRLPLNDELRGVQSPAPGSPGPLFVADAVSVTSDGERALLRFTLRVPGGAPRIVTEVLVPSEAIQGILAALGSPVGRVG